MINNFVFALRKYKFAASTFFILTYFYVCFCNIQRFFLIFMRTLFVGYIQLGKYMNLQRVFSFIFMYFYVSFATFEFAFLDIYA